MGLKVKGMIDEDDSRVAQVGHPAPPWMVNYADLMTELVCFFVILYALSAALSKDVQKASQDVQDMIKDGKMAGEVKVDKEGMRITLEEKSQVAFFESGKAELTDQMKAQMDMLSPVLLTLSQKHDIVVEGHTDNVPMYSKQFASNWELSTGRATNVVMYLLGKSFPPKRMAAVGYGEYHPIVPNVDDVSRKKNRRVVFFIKNTPYPDAKTDKASVGADGKKIVVAEETAGAPADTAPAVEPPPAAIADAQAPPVETPAEAAPAEAPAEAAPAAEGQ